MRCSTCDRYYDECRCDINDLKDRLDTEEAQYDDLKNKVATLFDAIKHGDEKHQEWLQAAMAEHFKDHWPKANR